MLRLCLTQPNNMVYLSNDMNDSVRHKLTSVQHLLFLFGAVFIALAVYFVVMTNTVLAGWTLFLAVALIIIGAVNPSLITELGLSRDKGLGLKTRHTPTEGEVEKVLSIADDKQSVSIAEEPLVQTAEKRDPSLKSATDYLLLATNAWKEKSYDDGLEYAYAGLSLHPDDKRIKATLEHRIGALFADLKANTSAVRYFKKAMGTDPGFAWPHHNLGLLLGKQGRTDDAEKEFRKAIILGPELTFTHNSLGILLKKQGRLEEAEEAYRKAIALDPDYADAHNNLGILLDKQGRAEEAEEACRKAIALDPDYADAHNNLGILLKKQGRSEEAEDAYRKAIALDPDYATAHNNLGVLLKSQGRLEEAERHFEKAKALEPE